MKPAGRCRKDVICIAGELLARWEAMESKVIETRNGGPSEPLEFDRGLGALAEWDDFDD